MDTNIPRMSIDWDRLDQDYREVRDALHPFEILEDDDYERFRLGWLTYGLIESTFRVTDDFEMNFGPQLQRAIPGSERYFLLVNLLSSIIVNPRENKYVPAHIADHIEAQPHPFRVIEVSLRNHAITNEFLDTWGRLHFLHGAHLILTNTEPTDEQLRQAMRTESTEIQQHWFAHWIRANAPSPTE